MKLLILTLLSLSMASCNLNHNARVEESSTTTTLPTGAIGEQLSIVLTQYNGYQGELDLNALGISSSNSPSYNLTSTRGEIQGSIFGLPKYSLKESFVNSLSSDATYDETITIHYFESGKLTSMELILSVVAEARSGSDDSTGSNGDLNQVKTFNASLQTLSAANDYEVFLADSNIPSYLSASQVQIEWTSSSSIPVDVSVVSKNGQLGYRIVRNSLGENQESYQNTTLSINPSDLKFIIPLSNGKVDWHKLDVDYKIIGSENGGNHFVDYGDFDISGSSNIVSFNLLSTQIATGGTLSIITDKTPNNLQGSNLYFQGYSAKLDLSNVNVFAGVAYEKKYEVQLTKGASVTILDLDLKFFAINGYTATVTQRRTDKDEIGYAAFSSFSERSLRASKFTQLGSGSEFISVDKCSAKLMEEDNWQALPFPDTSDDTIIDSEDIGFDFTGTDISVDFSSDQIEDFGDKWLDEKVGSYNTGTADGSNKKAETYLEVTCEGSYLTSGHKKGQFYLIQRYFKCEEGKSC